MAEAAQQLETAKKILIVDDEEDILDLHEMNLTAAGYEVEKALDGEEAIELLKKNTYDLVISDMKMKKIHGVGVLKYIRAQELDVEVILITGFSQLIEMKGASELGCSAFLAKPVDRKELLETVEKSLQPPIDESKAEDLEGQDGDFARIAIEDFISGKSVDFEVYVRLPSRKYVKVAHSGEDLDLDRIHTLKRKGLTELWLTKADFEKYMQFSMKMTISGALENEAVPLDTKARLVNHAAAVASENLRVMGLNAQNIETAQTIVTEAIKGIEHEDAGKAVLKIVESQEATPYAHCVSVATILALMTKVMGWSSKKNCHTLVLGGFFHDIGLMKLPKDIQEIKDPTRVSLDLRIQYEKHPYLGARELENIKSMPREVATIVAQHHENVHGTGFPKKLLRTDIFPMTRIVSLVDEFTERLLAAKPKDRAKPIALLKKMEKELRGYFDHTGLIALELALAEPNLDDARRKFQMATNRTA